ncbi:MAG: hypothetical protein AABY22_10325 [Nanoarchaeota archaeon]
MEPEMKFLNIFLAAKLFYKKSDVNFTVESKQHIYHFHDSGCPYYKYEDKCESCGNKVSIDDKGNVEIIIMNKRPNKPIVWHLLCFELWKIDRNTIKKY